MIQSGNKNRRNPYKIPDRDISRLAKVFSADELPIILEDAEKLWPSFIEEYFEEVEELIP